MNKSNKPNILYIMTDQQSAHMMSCAGTSWVNTPNIDRIAKKGILFNRAYCSNPVCIPSRFSLFTGQLPETMGLRSNVHKHLPTCDKKILEKGMGHLLSKEGYDCFFSGKQHFPGYKAEDLGFMVLTKDERNELANVVSKFIKSKHEKPWLLVTSFINPHDICLKALGDYLIDNDHDIEAFQKSIEYKTYSIFDKVPEGVTPETFYKDICPPLPANHQPQKDEPGILQDFLDQRLFKKHAANTYKDNDWRLHRYIYKKLTELVDKQIGKVLDALDNSDYVNNTLIIFTSDHGDMDGSHRFEHKTLLYEEAIKIPLIISHPGYLPEDIKTNILASNGLDLLPTVLEYIGAKIPNNLQGVNLLKAMNDPKKERQFVPIESELGRCIVTKDIKYAMYDYHKNNEQLYDYIEDPLEMNNHINNPKHQDKLREIKEQFEKQWDIEKRQKNISPLLF